MATECGRCGTLTDRPHRPEHCCTVLSTQVRLAAKAIEGLRAVIERTEAERDEAQHACRLLFDALVRMPPPLLQEQATAALDAGSALLARAGAEAVR